MLNQYAVDNPTLPVNLVFFPPQPNPGGMLSRSLGMPSRKNGPPSIWDTHGVSGNVFANPVASSSAPYPQELNPWCSHISEPIHSSQEVKNGNQTSVQDQRCQPGPWPVGSPRQAVNRRRRTRKGPEPACVRAPFGLAGGTRRGGRMN